MFAPNAEDLYNGNITSNSYNFGAIANEMEGKYRQGHFNGVGTVLELLFDIVKPDYAYFGEKDFQQLQIIRKLVETVSQGERMESPVEESKRVKKPNKTTAIVKMDVPRQRQPILGVGANGLGVGFLIFFFGFFFFAGIFYLFCLFRV